jgi:hypothetical protein
MADVVRQLARTEIHDVVRTGSAVQPREAAHPECNGVIRASRVAAVPPGRQSLAHPCRVGHHHQHFRNLRVIYDSFLDPTEQSGPTCKSA